MVFPLARNGTLQDRIQKLHNAEEYFSEKEVGYFFFFIFSLAT